MGKAKKKFKRRANVNLRAHYVSYRSSGTALRNKIRRNVKRVYGLVIARSTKKLGDKMRGKLKLIIQEKVTLAHRKGRLGNFLTRDLLDELAGN